MRSYRRLTHAAPALLAALFIGGLWGEVPPRHEIFPFASWFLFAKVPYQPVEYDVEFRAVDGQPLDPPRRFSRAAAWVMQPHSIATFNVIQALGVALERGQTARASTLRQQFEGSCGPATLEYDVVRVQYDPVIRYQTGELLNRRVLSRFTTQSP